MLLSNTMSAMTDDRKPLRMVACSGCGAKLFIPGDLPPFQTVACGKCGHEVMMPVLFRHFELRSAIASGGMGTVYRAFDTMLQREVAIKLMKRELSEDREALDSFAVKLARAPA